MISVFKINEEFAYAARLELLERNYRSMGVAFPELKVEFFYYITPLEPERFFIVRIKNAQRENFIKAVELFAANLSFSVLNTNQIKIFLSRTPRLDDYLIILN